MKNLRGYKQHFIVNFAVDEQYNVCDKFKYFKTYSDNSIGSENYASYTFDFITGHEVPYNGAVSLYIPTDYFTDLYTLNSTCEIQGFSEKAFCKIGERNRVDIIMNGIKLYKDREYSVKITNMSNPIDPENLYFYLRSYYNEDLYLD